MHISCRIYCFELEYCTMARSQMLAMVTLFTDCACSPVGTLNCIFISHYSIIVCYLTSHQILNSKGTF